MDVKVKFLGAAKTVTGSKYYLEIDDFNLLVDCGLFQGLKEQRLRNWSELPVDVNKIDAVVLTHAHIDHSGYLPRLVKDGFSGPIYCTSATASLLEIMLRDAAKLQEEEAEFARKKGYSRHENPQPLFNSDDAEAALSMLVPHPYKKTITISDRVQVSFYDAGHILGSSIVELLLHGSTQQKKIVFSGDLGRYNQPLLHDPTTMEEADILFIESTYGDRLNSNENLAEEFATIVNEALDKGGCLLIPSFAVGRTQLLLYYFHYLFENKLVPEIPVYVDSPMAISATQIHKKHREDHKLSEGREDSIFDNAFFKYYRSQESSLNLNDVNNQAVIISASGMCTGGRILHHLYHRLPRKNDTLLFTGYQAEGTRGRRLLEGEPTSRIFGIDVPVKCHVKHINGLSAHGDQAELLRWAGNYKNAPKMTFIVHGEEKGATIMARKLQKELNWPNVVVPNYLESFELFSAI